MMPGGSRSIAVKVKCYQSKDSFVFEDLLLFIVCVCVCYFLMPVDTKRNLRSLELHVVVSQCWDLNLGPHQEQQVHLTAGPLLQLSKDKF